jgi:peptide/nickel transport system permease protein
VSADGPTFLRRLLPRPLALACIVYLVAVIGVALLAPVLMPGVAHQYAGDLLSVRQGPSAQHLLGTDTLGRDVLDRLLVGARSTMIGVAEGVLVALALGIPLGLAAGFFGGRLDRFVNWVADLTFSLPAVVIILVVLAVFPGSALAGMVTFGVLAAPGLMRVIRSATLPIREELYVDAARVSGLSDAYIVRCHVLPRISGVVIVQTSLLAAVALLVQTGLAFLNLFGGTSPNWGAMVADGVGAISLQPWLIWPPGIAMGLTVLALALLGDSVRDVSAASWSAAVATGTPSRRPAAPSVAAVRSPEGQLLAVDGLQVVFPSDGGPVPVTDGVTLTVAEGETVGLVGESGCGKSVTAKAILGLVPGGGWVAEGRILFAGRDLTAASERELRRLRGREIALISQEPMVALDPAFRVGTQLVEAVRRHRGLSRRDARRQALELLERVHLADPEAVARRYPHELSGGMAQRIAIARALAGEPRLLIADEPTTALDVTVQAEILELLRDLQRERGMAILLVTHDWGVVADICDRSVVMYAGQVVERGESASLFHEPRHPYTEALLASSPHSAPIGELLASVPGSVPAPGSWPPGCRFEPRCRYTTAECLRPVALEEIGPGREARCIHHDLLRRSR